MNKLVVLLSALLLLGCQPSESPENGASPEPAPVPEQGVTAVQPAEQAGEARPQEASEYLDAVLERTPEEFKARYQYRHPKETLEFFGIEPGMTVVEALPGAGWYTQILVPYLGEEGRLIGANYAHEVWPLMGYDDPEFLESISTWTTSWPQEVEAWRAGGGAAIDAFEFGSMPEEMTGQADAVLFIRALHSMAQFEGSNGFLTEALEETMRVLKPGGIVGVVQHEARPEMSDEWASGAQGYLKKQYVIDAFTEAGFEFVAESGINENPKDRPTEADNVWRLPPSLGTSEDNPELRAQMDQIGESHRMTLKFRKP